MPYVSIISDNCENQTNNTKTSNGVKFRVRLLLKRSICSGADNSLARPGRKQANVSVRMAWISFGALPCKKKKLDDSSRLDVVEIVRVSDMFPSLLPSWSVYRLISTPVHQPLCFKALIPEGDTSNVAGCTDDNSQHCTPHATVISRIFLDVTRQEFNTAMYFVWYTPI